MHAIQHKDDSISFRLTPEERTKLFYLIREGRPALAQKDQTYTTFALELMRALDR